METEHDDGRQQRDEDEHQRSILETFRELGMDASYHFADDSGKEWNLGFNLKGDAQRLFIDNPSLQPEMREIAKGFLWQLDKHLEDAK